MRSLLLSFKLLPIALFSFFLIGCSDDDEDHNLRRDTDKLSFSYANSSQQFTVRTKGSWSVSSSAGWLSFEPASGSGNGKDYQYVTVTAEHNTGDERTGVIKLSGGGIESEISVVQENGLFELGTPTLQGKLLQGEEANMVYIAIPYKKSGGTEKMSATITLSGEASGGLSVEDINDLVLTQGDNIAKAVISGTPASIGSLKFTINITVNGKPYETITLNADVISANIIFSQYFEKMVWGGDYMAQTSGIKSGKGDNATPYDSGADIITATANTDGTNNMFGARLRNAFVNDPANPRGVLGWDGWGIFERPGYIKLGTGTYSGWIATPPLDLSSIGGSGDIYVSFDYSMWHQDPGAVTPFKVEGSGVAAVSSLSSSDNFTWKRYVVKISGAKTGDVIVWGDNSVKGTNNNIAGQRYLLDNIEISSEAGEKPSAPLTIPTSIALKEAQAKSLTFSWDAVQSATGYKMELALKNNPGFAVTMETGGTEYTFESLIGGQDYTFKIMAVYNNDESFNSPWSEAITARTLGMVPKIANPTLSIVETTHGKIIIGWELVEGWNDLTDRKFLVELAESSNGPASRSYTITETNKKYRFNRFVFGKLDQNKTHYCRVQLLPGTKDNKDYDPSDVVVISATTGSKPTVSANNLLYKDFEDFWYGGDGSYGAFGVLLSSADQKAFNPSQEFFYTLGGTTNTIGNLGDSFNTGSTSDMYRASRWGTTGATGWEGTRVYEVASYIKFGTGSADGVLTTPPLTALSSTTNIKVTFDACPYTEPHATTGDMIVSPSVENSLKFFVKVVGSGTIDGAPGTGKEKELTNNSNEGTDPNVDRLNWTAHTLNITGADATTRITIGTYNTDGNRRMWLDNIRIDKN